MEFDTHIIWNIILTFILIPLAWWVRTTHDEMRRQDILLNKTREDYAKRDDVTVAINRLEEKIDRILERMK